MERIDPSLLVKVAPGQYEVRRPGWQEIEERKAAERAESERRMKEFYNHIDKVTTDKAKGPRGDYYDWCALRPDGTLDFGEEQGNYAGGHTLSPLYYPGEHDYCEEQTSLDVGKGYWFYALRCLERWKEKDRVFYDRIMDMLDRHGVKLPYENRAD